MFSVLSDLKKRFSYPLLSSQSVGRILRRTLVLLLAFMTLILSVFYITVRSLSQENYLQERYRQSLSLLQQTDRSMLVSLNHLNTQSSTFLSSSSVTSAMVRQGQTDFDQSYDIISGLGSLLANSPLVTASWLYLPASGSVFCSDQQILALTDCPEALQNLITGKHSGLFVSEQQLYYALSYPQSTSLGTLLLRLDTSALYRSTLNENQSVYIYAPDMTALFSSACRYPASAPLAKTIYSGDSSAFYLSSDSKARYYTLYRSSSTGLIYLTIEDKFSFLPALQDSLRLFLPCGLLILVGTALFSLYSLHSVYRPVQRALDILVSAPLDSPAAAPAVPQLQQALSAVAPDIFRLLFRRILYDGMSDPSEIAQSLKGLPPVFPTDSPYFVLRLEAQCDSAAQTGELYRRLYALHLKELCEHYWQGKTPFLSDENSQGFLLLFISCQPFPAQQPQNALTDFVHYLKQETKELAYDPLLGYSGVYDGLQNLSAAFSAASQDLSYRRYYNLAPQPSEAPDSLEEHFLKKTQSILQKALHREKNIADALANELCSESVPADLRPAALRTIHTCVVRQLIDCSIDPASCSFLNPAYTEDSSRLIGSESDFAYIRSLLMGAIEALYEHGQNSRNQYLADAKDYIAQHYTETSLSLDSVSQHVGISSPYLSSIFSELQGQRFLDYLNRFRVEKATQLLQSTDINISEIGFRTGFYSANTFIRTFKKITGETPGAYRTRRAGSAL